MGVGGASHAQFRCGTHGTGDGRKRAQQIALRHLVRVIVPRAELELQRGDAAGRCEPRRRRTGRAERQRGGKHEHGHETQHGQKDAGVGDVWRCLFGHGRDTGISAASRMLRALLLGASFASSIAFTPMMARTAPCSMRSVAASAATMQPVATSTRSSSRASHLVMMDPAKCVQRVWPNPNHTTPFKPTALHEPSLW